MPNVDFTLNDIRGVVREEIHDHFEKTAKPYINEAISDHFESVAKPFINEVVHGHFETVAKPYISQTIHDGIEDHFETVAKPYISQTIHDGIESHFETVAKPYISQIVTCSIDQSEDNLLNFLTDKFGETDARFNTIERQIAVIHTDLKHNNLLVRKHSADIAELQAITSS